MAVTVEKNIQFKPIGEKYLFPAASGATIYKGALHVITKEGYLENLGSTNLYEARCVAIPMDNTSDVDGPQATTSAGSISGTYQETSVVAGDKTCRLCHLFGEIELTFSSITQADLGKTVYASDNYTVDEAQSGGLAVGTLVKYISATKGTVLLNTFFEHDGRKKCKFPVTAATTTTGGDAISWANPTGTTIIVENVLLDITTQATGAATMDIGVAANGTTTSDTLIDEVDVGAAAIVASAINDGGTNGKGFRKMTSTQYITGTPSATLAGIAGTCTVLYWIHE